MDEYLETWVKFTEKLYGMQEYRLTMKEIEQICRDYCFDNHDGYVSNNQSWIEYWMSKNGIDEI